MPHSYIPSPPQGVWHLGSVPVRAYALCILAGIWLAVWLTNRRFVARGGRAEVMSDVAMWAVPFGILGGRLYHVLTDWQKYFGVNGKGFAASLKIWEGGLGIWGAIALGALGGFIGCQQHGIRFAVFADVMAPGLALAQACGRWGNWFNQELFGKPTTAPWALEIDLQHRPAALAEFATFHPTFLYESLWCVAIAFVVMAADRKFIMGHGRVFALYLALYCAGRGVIETLRVDDATHILGFRINVFTSIIVGVAAVAYLVISAERHPGREVLRGRELPRRPFIPVEPAKPEVIVDDVVEEVAAGVVEVGAELSADVINEVSLNENSVDKDSEVEVSDIEQEEVIDDAETIHSEEVLATPVEAEAEGNAEVQADAHSETKLDTTSENIPFKWTPPADYKSDRGRRRKR